MGVSVDTKNNNENIDETFFLPTQVSVSYSDPLDFTSYQIESIVNDEKVNTTSKKVKKNSQISAGNVNIDFNKVDDSITRMVKYLKNIDNSFNRIIVKLNKIKSESKVDCDEVINFAIKSCKKRVTYNENKIVNLESTLHMDMRDMILFGYEQQKELEKRVLELEHFMLAQIVYNNNVSQVIQRDITK